ncbi:ATP-binding protein [Clostridium sp. WILCCON 0269]|uniref:histidine kinase n=1 Tax=Candidatus Clostridium eludens TaxID=3381663 RepID=A0ABW8SJI3_9CLOT
MRKSVLFNQIFALVVGTIILYGILGTPIFLFITHSMFKDLEIQDLKPRAAAMSEMLSTYQKEAILNRDIKKLNDLYSSWSDVLYIYDRDGKIMVEAQGDMISKLNKNERLQLINKLNETFKKYIPLILRGKHIVGNEEQIHFVGEPIMNKETVIGEAFLSKPPEELQTAFLGFSRSISLSAFVVFLLMIFPVYKVAKRIINPLKDMQNIAIKMAHGNLTLKASESYKGEIGELGQSLNYLSSKLSETIADLKIERNRLKQIIDGLSEGIIAIDSKHNITHINPAIHSIFNTSEKKDCIEVVPIKEFWEDFDIVFSKGYAIARNIPWNQVVLRITICPLENETNEIVGAVGLFQDITASERLEQTRREYVANVSHELRTPVAALRAFLETIIDGMITDEEVKKRYYTYMFHETMRLSRLIDDLLTLSRLQTDSIFMDNEEFAIGEIMENVAERYSVLAEEKKIKFSFVLPPENLVVMSNIDLIEQVLIILLDNAIKYTQEKGNVSLYAHLEGNSVKVSVADTGMGIYPEDLPHIFERFYKSDKARTSRGTGLGLAIAYEIIQQLNEKIFVDSTPGKGSIFTFTLSIASNK